MKHLSATVFLLCAFAGLAGEPSWWRARGVTNGNASDDFAAANLGQLKNIARAASEELDAKIPHGAGTEIKSLLAGFSRGDDFAAINLGQLKAAAKPFYDRLIAEGFAKEYPWNSRGTSDDSAAANLGQLKNIFSFEIPARK